MGVARRRGSHSPAWQVPTTSGAIATRRATSPATHGPDRALVANRKRQGRIVWFVCVPTKFRWSEYLVLREEPDRWTADAAIRFVKEAGVDLIKLDGAADYPEAVTALTRAGVPVWAQFGITPQTALQYGIEYAAMSGADATVTADMQERLVAEAKMLEEAGAVLLDFTNSGPIVGPVVAEAVSIPVIGGFGGGPWLDGRVRMAHAAVGYSAKHLDGNIETYANVAKTSFDALTAFSKDVRAGRQIKGAPKARK